MSVLRSTTLMKLEVTVYYLWLSFSPLRVTEDNLVFDTDLSGPPSFFWMFSMLLKELSGIYLFLKQKKMLESSGNDIISSLNNIIIPSLNEIFSFELVFFLRG